MTQKSDFSNLCKTNGFSLRERFLEGRLLMVLIKPTIIVKRNLEKKKKASLVSTAISHLLKYPNCRLAIFWRGQNQFFHL